MAGAHPSPSIFCCSALRRTWLLLHHRDSIRLQTPTEPLLRCPPRILAVVPAACWQDSFWYAINFKRCLPSHDTGGGIPASNYLVCVPLVATSSAAASRYEAHNILLPHFLRLCPCTLRLHAPGSIVRLCLFTSRHYCATSHPQNCTHGIGFHETTNARTQHRKDSRRTLRLPTAGPAPKRHFRLEPTSALIQGYCTLELSLCSTIFTSAPSLPMACQHAGALVSFQPPADPPLLASSHLLLFNLQPSTT